MKHSLLFYFATLSSYILLVQTGYATERRCSTLVALYPENVNLAQAANGDRVILPNVNRHELNIYSYGNFALIRHAPMNLHDPVAARWTRLDLISGETTTLSLEAHPETLALSRLSEGLEQNVDIHFIQRHGPKTWHSAEYNRVVEYLPTSSGFGVLSIFTDKKILLTQIHNVQVETSFAVTGPNSILLIAGRALTASSDARAPQQALVLRRYFDFGLNDALDALPLLDGYQ